MTAHLCPPRPFLLLGLVVLACAACRAPLEVPSQGATALRPPPPRRAGERLPAFAGNSPEARGWVRVRGLFWVEAAQRDAWELGRVFDGTRWQGREEAGPLARPASAGYLIRTDHVSLRTNASWPEAEALARQAQTHVEALFAAYGDDLDLRFPSGPLTVIAHRDRGEYRAALESVAPGHHGWGAFYDGATGAVHVCTEPAPVGALPLVSDLRHEMTHQLLDLSSVRPGDLGSRIPWLWEGFAVHAETLGEGDGSVAGRARRERFARRRARGEVTPLGELFLLRAGALEGRHYDQLAVLFAFLMADGIAGSRRATLESVHAVLQGATSPTAFERRLGIPAEALDRAWRESL